MKYRILVLCDFNRYSANTIIDHATSFKKYSRHNIFFFNPVGKNKPGWLSLSKFDFLIIHYSIYVLGDYYINQTWRFAIKESPAVKIQFIQDEYRRVNEFVERMKELEINILYTCYPEEEIEKVYPEEKLPGVRKINTLTGYVPDYLDGMMPDFDGMRSIDVGYRGRGEGMWWLGSLYQEKSFIGREFLKHARKTDLKCDISSREEDRIYGKDWVNFLKSCRCTLGTESGASVIDFTGKVEDNVRQYCSQNPSATFDEVRALFFKETEGTIRMNQISPRVFEATGCGCSLILFEGDYSKILRPGVHYIELKKDFGNIEHVFEMIRDRQFTKEMARRTYQDVIRSGLYSYKAFVTSFDRDLDEYMASSSNTQMAIPFPPGFSVTASASCPTPDATPVEAASTALPASASPKGFFDRWMAHLIFKLSSCTKNIIARCQNVLDQTLYKSTKVGRFIWMVIVGLYYKAKFPLIYLYYHLKNQYYRVKRVLRGHPFFLVEKGKLIGKIFKEM